MSGQLDSWTVEKDGIKYRIDIDSDYDGRPDDDGMRDETRAAFDRGEWQYVGVTVTPLIQGVDENDPSWLSDSLWGVEWGDLPPASADGIPTDDPRYGPDDPGLTIGREYIANVHPVPDMVIQVRSNLAKLRDKLVALNLGES